MLRCTGLARSPGECDCGGSLDMTSVVDWKRFNGLSVSTVLKDAKKVSHHGANTFHQADGLGPADQAIPTTPETCVSAATLLDTEVEILTCSTTTPMWR